MKWLLQVLLLAGLVAIPGRSGVLSAQSSAPASVPASEAEAFLGAWTLSVDVDGQMLNLDLVIREQDGALAGDVTSELGYSSISRFSRRAESLVMGYTAEMNGESFPVVLTMTPTAEGADLEVDAAEGSFFTRGKGVRK